MFLCMSESLGKNKLIILRGSGSPNRTSVSFKNDPYYIWASTLINNKLLDSADFVITNAHKQSKYTKYRLRKDIVLHYCPNNKDLKRFKECKRILCYSIQRQKNTGDGCV